jgi:hypothetical protein
MPAKMTPKTTPKTTTVPTHAAAGRAWHVV